MLVNSIKINYDNKIGQAITDSVIDEYAQRVLLLLFKDAESSTIEEEYGTLHQLVKGVNIPENIDNILQEESNRVLDVINNTPKDIPESILEDLRITWGQTTQDSLKLQIYLSTKDEEKTITI